MKVPHNHGKASGKHQPGTLASMIRAIERLDRTYGRGKGRRGRAARFVFYLVGITVVSMPFLISLVHVSSLQYLSEFEDCGGGSNNVLTSFLTSSHVNSRIHSPHRGQRPSPSESLPSYGYSLDHPPPDAPYHVLHTVTTRFMVGQAPQNETMASKMFEIAWARYLLFEAFCWPTVKYQTSMNFYWLVLVDPGLDARILGNLTRLLGSAEHFPAGNAYMVLTNNTAWASDGIGVENSTSYGVGLQPVAQGVRDGSLEVVTGKMDHLLRALDAMEGKAASRLRAAKPLQIIETLLDADDGLNNRAVEWIQTTALQKSRHHRQLQLREARAIHPPPAAPPLSLATTWWFLCGTDHIEWHNREIYQLTEDDYASAGITSGLAGLRKSPLFCTSAGFTRVGLTDVPTQPSQSHAFRHVSFPKDGYSNHALTFYFPECSKTVEPRGNYSACWHREFPGEAFILKSRTITSDSMDHLNVGKSKDYRDVSWLNASDYPLEIREAERTWETLRREFSVDRSRAWELSVYVYEHRERILIQNYRSRCSPGFPCFAEAKKNLIRMQRYWKKLKREKEINELNLDQVKKDALELALKQKEIKDQAKKKNALELALGKAAAKQALQANATILDGVASPNATKAAPANATNATKI